MGTITVICIQLWYVLSLLLLYPSKGLEQIRLYLQRRKIEKNNFVSIAAARNNISTLFKDRNLKMKLDGGKDHLYIRCKYSSKKSYCPFGMRLILLHYANTKPVVVVAGRNRCKLNSHSHSERCGQKGNVRSVNSY